MLRFAENFGFWDTAPGTFTAFINGSGSVGVSGGLLAVTNNAGVLLSDGLDAQGTWIINCRVNLENLPGGTGGSGYPSNAWPIFALFDGNDIQCGLFVIGNGKLRFYRGSTAIGATSTTAIVADAGLTYYDIEAKIVLGASGSIECRINGGLEIGPTTVDTTSTANDTADSIIFGQNGGGGITVFVASNWEHLIALDGQAGLNDFLGPINVNLHTPNADGNYTTWAPSAGARYQCVDEITGPNGDTDYVSASNVGDKVSFGLTNTPAGVTTIKGACAWINARRDDATTRGVKILLRYSGADELGTTELFVGPSYLYHFQNFDESPFSTDPWTTTEIDGLEVGCQITT